MANMVFEPHNVETAGAGGDVVFCVVIICLSVISMIIFAASAADGAARTKRRANGPVFVGGRGCACGGCRAGAGVCGTYLS